jgi:hypothetical protein
MSDELKDFRYYADKAEAAIGISMQEDIPARGEDICVRIAAVYAELAKAAPKADETPEPICDGDHGRFTERCNSWLERPEGSYRCTIPKYAHGLDRLHMHDGLGEAWSPREGRERDK